MRIKKGDLFKKLYDEMLSGDKDRTTNIYDDVEYTKFQDFKTFFDQFKKYLLHNNIEVITDDKYDNITIIIDHQNSIYYYPIVGNKSIYFAKVPVPYIVRANIDAKRKKQRELEEGRELEEQRKQEEQRVNEIYRNILSDTYNDNINISGLSNDFFNALYSKHNIQLFHYNEKKYISVLSTPDYNVKKIYRMDSDQNQLINVSINAEIRHVAMNKVKLKREENETFERHANIAFSDRDNGNGHSRQRQFSLANLYTHRLRIRS